MAKPISSPLITVANNIVSLNTRSKRSLPKFVSEYKSFVSFISSEKAELERIRLPEKKKIKALANLNIASNFGSPGGLLRNLASGALDVAGFLGNMFPSFGNSEKPRKPSGKPPKPIAKGPKLKFGGLRSVGIVNAIFAGLDFSTGLQEGESVGKSAAGTGGSLAGSLLGGAIGQALIPIPGVGFVLGSMAGGFLGGYAADRAYEAGEKALTQKQQEKIKSQEQRQKAAASEVSYDNVTEKFGDSVGKFEKFIHTAFASMINAASGAAGSDEMILDYGLDPDSVPDAPSLPGELPEVTAEGGQLPSKYFSSPYGWRWGRLHSGVDYETTEGTPVSVIQPGQVSYVGNDPKGYGNFIMISHPGGNTSLYGHLSKISVKQGQQVEPGSVIGNVGSTGRSTGPHVHFEVRQGSKRLPIPNNEGDKYFRFGGNVKIKSASSGKPTAVLMAGTNDYNDPKKGAAGITKAIKELQAKGYKVVVVPPSEQGAYANVSKEVQKAASDAGATIEKGQYDSKDSTRAYTHLLPESAKAIQSKYKGATFVGDSNAGRVSGGMSYVGESASSIAEKIKSNVPSAQTRPGIGGAEADPKMLELYKSGVVNQVSDYPSYNKQGQSSVVLMPIALPTSGGGSSAPIVVSGGGGGTQIIPLPGPSDSEVVNSLMKTMLLTNLSGS